MIALLGIIVGIVEFDTLVCMCVLQWACIITGGISEKLQHRTPWIHYAAWIPYTVNWVILLVRYYNTSSMFPYLQFLIPLQLLLFSLFGAVQTAQKMKVPFLSNFVMVEVSYMTLSVAAKSVLAGSMFLAIVYG
jgi:Heliorhodopsin